jgi:hypothetical protein
MVEGDPLESFRLGPMVFTFFGEPADSFLTGLAGDLLEGERGGIGKASAGFILCLPTGSSSFGDLLGVRGV